MNYKLIVALSMFGLAMGIATVFVVPSNVEPLFWLAVFLLCAYVIAARAPGGYFLHGLALGVVNAVWVTGFHVLFARQYIANHPQEVAMMASMPLPTHPRIMMGIIGPIVGVVSGAVIGVLAVIASKIVTGRPAAAIPRQ